MQNLSVPLQAILCAGLYPNIAAGEQGIVAAALSSLKQSSSSANSGRTVWFDGRREVHIHPSSINSNAKAFQYPFLVFLEKVCELLQNFVKSPFYIEMFLLTHDLDMYYLFKSCSFNWFPL